MQVQSYPIPSIRIDPDNSNHHLWGNHGTWYVAYTVLTSPITSERKRASLGTKDVVVARTRRDQLLGDASHG